MTSPSLTRSSRLQHAAVAMTTLGNDVARLNGQVLEHSRQDYHRREEWRAVAQELSLALANIDEAERRLRRVRP